MPSLLSHLHGIGLSSCYLELQGLSYSLGDFKIGRLQELEQGAGQTPRYPICFLTNGGGVTEQQKADELSSWLGVRVRDNQARRHPTLRSRCLPYTCQEPEGPGGVQVQYSTANGGR